MIVPEAEKPTPLTPGLKRGELDEVAPVQRQLVDQLFDSRPCRAKTIRIQAAAPAPVTSTVSRDLAHLQGEVELRLLVDLQRDAALHELAKSGRFHAERCNRRAEEAG